MQLVLEGSAPSCQPKLVGMLQGNGRLRDSIYGCSQDETIKLIRGEAAQQGLDGVMNVKCAAPGLVGYENCSCAGDGFVCVGPAVAAPPSGTERTCAPGATQVCVGAGACRGGQTCLPDGSGWGKCDCGGS